MIHVWAAWGRDTCHLGRYINSRTFTFKSYMIYHVVPFPSGVIFMRLNDPNVDCFKCMSETAHPYRHCWNRTLIETYTGLCDSWACCWSNFESAVQSDNSAPASVLSFSRIILRWLTRRLLVSHPTLCTVLTTLENLENMDISGNLFILENSGNLKFTQGIYQMLFFCDAICLSGIESCA